MNRVEATRLVANNSELIKDEFLPIVKAFAEGKDVQVLNNEGTWSSRSDLMFNLDISMYRIKPKDTYVPFISEDALLFRDRWIRFVKHNSLNTLERIDKYDSKSVVIDGLKFSYSDLLKRCVFDDGTPCGKIV